MIWVGAPSLRALDAVLLRECATGLLDRLLDQLAHHSHVPHALNVGGHAIKHAQVVRLVGDGDARRLLQKLLARLLEKGPSLLGDAVGRLLRRVVSFALVAGDYDAELFLDRVGHLARRVESHYVISTERWPPTLPKLPRVGATRNARLRLTL